MSAKLSSCKCLLLYTSVDGHTRRIMEFIAGILNETGNDCEVHNLDEQHEHYLDLYNKVLIGTPVRYSKISKHVISFINKNADKLNCMPSALFIVNLVARKENKNTPETNVYTRKLLKAIPWVPTLCAVFAGALYYPRYTFYDRWLIWLIMHMSGGETDMTKEIVYTNWDAVTSFARSFNALPLTVPRAVKVFTDDKFDDPVARSKRICKISVALFVSAIAFAVYAKQRKLKFN